MKDPVFIQQQVQKTMEAKEKAAAALSGLSTGQLTWKPHDTAWSIAECLEHLIIADGLRIQMIEQKINNDFQHNSWEKFNPLKKFWGTMLVTQTHEKVKNKIKAPRRFRPAAGLSSHDLLLRFGQHQDTITHTLKQCGEADLDLVHITSPVSRMVTYSLRNAIIIITGHEWRHINQAIRVKQMSEFPS